MAIVDVRDRLREAKGRERIYCRTDSHWNDRGAFVAYQQIMTALQRWYPGLAPLPREAFADAIDQEPGGDLAAMIGMKDVVREEGLLLRPRVPRRAQAAIAGMTMPHLTPWRQPHAFEIPGASLPRAVMLRDSFGNALMPFLSEHFRRILYLYTKKLSPEVIAREEPQVVIQEFVERRLMQAPFGNDVDHRVSAR